MTSPDPGPLHQQTLQPQESSIEITYHDVTLRSLPQALEGIKVVQLTDFHRGCGNTDKRICLAIEMANGLEPDILLLTGDFVNEHRQDIGPAVSMVAGLKARLGTYAVLGNHDHKSDAAMLTSMLEAAGIRVLHNRSVEVQPGLCIAGVDDLVEGAPDFPRTLAGVSANEAVILLSHNPNGFDLLPSNSGALVLSGHTHGGQIAVRFPSPEIICRFHLHTRYVAGWYERAGAKLYVNRGIGVTGSGPLARRVNCLPEISVFRLVPP